MFHVDQRGVVSSLASIDREQYDTKTPSLTWNSRSRSFKVIHFAISYKPARDCLSPCNNAVLISKVSAEEFVASDREQYDRFKFPVVAVDAGTPSRTGSVSGLCRGFWERSSAWYFVTDTQNLPGVYATLLPFSHCALLNVLAMDRLWI